MSSGGVRGGVAVEFYESPLRRSVRPRTTAERKGSVPKTTCVLFVLFTQETFWGVLEILDDGSFDFHCVSNETSTALPFPVEATWICKSGG